MVGCPSWRSGMGRESLPEVQDESGGPHEGPERVKRPSQTGQVSFPEIWDRLGVHPDGSVKVRRPSRKSSRSSQMSG